MMMPLKKEPGPSVHPQICRRSDYSHVCCSPVKEERVSGDEKSNNADAQHQTAGMVSGAVFT